MKLPTKLQQPLKEENSNFDSITGTVYSFATGNLSYNEAHANSLDSSISYAMPSNIDREIEERVKYLDNHYKARLIQMIYREEFFPGESNETISFVARLRRYTDVALEKWFNNLYSEYYNTLTVLKGLLYIMLYYNDLFSATLTNVALASVSNKSCEIQELGIRMLESNCCKNHLEALKGLKHQDSWLQEYIEQLISDFEKQLCQS